MDLLLPVALILASYLLGAVPTGLIVAGRRWRDLLGQGSGKTGATNSLGVLGKQAAVLVFLGDMLKGGLAVLLARALFPPSSAWHHPATALAGAAAIVGHNWSLWVRLLSGKWAGGRGIMPAVGALFVVHPLTFVPMVLGAALGQWATRYMVLGMVSGGLTGGLVLAALVATAQIAPDLFWAGLLWSAIVMLGFADSFSRLVRGKEPKIGE